MRRTQTSPQIRAQLIQLDRLETASRNRCLTADESDELARLVHNREQRRRRAEAQLPAAKAWLAELNARLAEC